MASSWHIFGPLNCLAQPPGEPIAALTGEATSWPIPPEHQPAEGTTAVFLLRRIDELGRSEKSDRHVRVQRISGGLVVAPPPPIFPDRPGWRPRLSESGWQLDFLWPGSFDEMSVTELRLIQERVGDPPEVRDARQPPARQCDWRLSVPATDQSVRFRAEAINADGASSISPWSAWLASPGSVPTPLQLI